MFYKLNLIKIISKYMLKLIITLFLWLLACGIGFASNLKIEIRYCCLVGCLILELGDGELDLLGEFSRYLVQLCGQGWVVMLMSGCLSNLLLLVQGAALWIHASLGMKLGEGGVSGVLLSDRSSVAAGLASG